VISLPITNGVYRTAPGVARALARLSPGAVFYSRILGVVWRAGAKAKRGQYDDQEWAHSSFTVVRALEAAGAQLDISGLDQVTSAQGASVFIGNHMSTLETFVLPVLLLPYKRVTFVVKQSLLDYPVFGHVMRSRDPIAVGRSNPREDLRAVLDGGAERLARGLSIIVFPQTTRTPRFDPAEFNTIGVKLASRANVPVIPIALKTDAWGNGRLLKDCGKFDPSKTIHIAFGAPLRITDRGTDAHRTIVEFITSKLSQWGGTIAG
jgi:1-acyl-sn-glycerol-3-phosphate acyltransferase